MKLISPTRALIWEIWQRHRVMLSSAFVGIAAGGIASHFLGPDHRWTRLAVASGYTGLCVILLMAFAAFHFTEGQKKGGFGSFPMRLFRLPVSTRWLVAVPMVAGAVLVVSLYLSAAFFIFRPLGRDLPVMWPCLYLIFALTQFQMIVWSFPGRRYVKLLCLSFAATMILIGWMFFLPHVVEGTLSDWGYTGNPQSFMRMLLIAVALAGPVAYLISLQAVQRQRHGSLGDSKWNRLIWDFLSASFLRRSSGFRSAWHAIFWQEWRRTGLILPCCVAVILAIICIPTIASQPIGVRGTRAVILGLLLAPLLLALIIGRGLAKPDFWNASLGMSLFDAIRPIPAGGWVSAKLAVAAGSTLLTWIIVLSAGSLWFLTYGDFQTFAADLESVRYYFSPGERFLLLPLGLMTFLLLTWRFLVGGLPSGLSGNRIWFFAQNMVPAVFLVSLLTYLITGHESESHPDSQYHRLWPYVTRLPILLGIAVIAKALSACFLWQSVIRRKHFTAKAAGLYCGSWILATTAPAALVLIVSESTLWLKASLLLMALLWVPLCSPPLAMLSLANNRSHS